MKLLLFRHGIAEEPSPDKTDASRRLTDKGIRKTTLAARGLARVIDRPQVLFTSPLTRARETADILAKELGLSPKVLDALAMNDVPQIVGELAGRSEERVLLVGHEPTFSRLAAWLLTGIDPAGFIELKKAGAILLDAPIAAASHGSAQDAALAGGARLLWLATPKMLRAMAG